MLANMTDIYGDIDYIDITKLLANTHRNFKPWFKRKNPEEFPLQIKSVLRSKLTNPSTLIGPLLSKSN